MTTRPGTRGASLLQRLVRAFAEATAHQTDAIMSGDARSGNRHARRYIAAFAKLAAIGDEGRDALAALFTHERPDVRVMAAAFLLRHRTADATAVLRNAAAGKGLVSFEAAQCLERWAEGSWALNPESAARFPGFDHLFCVDSSGGSRQFIADLDLGDADPLAVTRGTAEVSLAHARWAMGSTKPGAIVWTTSAFPVLLSHALVDALGQADISGWASYPVELRGKKGVELGTYHGLVIRGRCGPIDKNRSSIAPSTSPTGPGWVVKGLFFDARSWDGSDIFMPEDDTAFVFFTERAKDLFAARGRGLDIKALTDWTIATYAWSV